MSDETNVDPDAQPTEAPLRPDDWASTALSAGFVYHRRGWLKSVTKRGLRMVYKGASFWQADFEKWAKRPVGGR